VNIHSEERKELQTKGLIPQWFSTQGYQLFKDKYQWANTAKQQYLAIARTAAIHLIETPWAGVAAHKFFKLLWRGWLSPSTPILGNMGSGRGMPVSCSGGYIKDSIDGFYTARHETAMLTKNGFGTSGYLGDIRSRGSSISAGGVASGVLPVFKGFVRDMEEVAQGTTRRGAWAGYLPITHGDFDELCSLLHHSPDGLNVGWVVTDEFVHLLDAGDAEAIRRYQKAMKVKMITGKGYFFFVDKANRHRPECYKELDLDIKASNLCTEIMLHSSEDYTFTCVLSSMNLAKYDEWKDSDAVFWATLFLDCVAEEFIYQAEYKPGMKKAVEFTKKGRALGLGVCGFHTYLQQHGLPFESLEAQFVNDAIFKSISARAKSASSELARELGEPEWCKGTNRRNTHVMAIAPTKSTALIMGGVSEGINPDPGMCYTATTAAGEVERIAPAFLNLMKQKGQYNDENIKSMVGNFGSVQHFDWLDEHEKAVFKTAFEIDQRVVVRLASQRQRHLDQGQSINLFFTADDSAEYISEVHKQAFRDENILSLYYCYSQAGVKASDRGECVACS
jgi:ribonucleoside-diphosphate reductase alpha chain